MALRATLPLLLLLLGCAAAPKATREVRPLGERVGAEEVWAPVGGGSALNLCAAARPARRALRWLVDGPARDAAPAALAAGVRRSPEGDPRGASAGRAGGGRGGLGSGGGWLRAESLRRGPSSPPCATLAR